jgi:hypothetical protein
MPKMCFSYPSETGRRGVVPPVRDSKLCFRYHADIRWAPETAMLSSHHLRASSVSATR